MKNILVPIDDDFYYPNWLDGYKNNNCNIIGGLINFWNIGSTPVDIVHIQWPEFLVRSGASSDRNIGLVVEQVKKWRKSGCKGVGGVPNIYPHGFGGCLKYKKLYEETYGNCDLIQHFSVASKCEFIKKYDTLADKNHIISSGVGYNHLLAIQSNKKISRKDYDLSEEDFVILVFGALRSWDEFNLVRNAFDRVKIKNKKLLITDRFKLPGSKLNAIAGKVLYKTWQKISGVSVLPEPVADEDLLEIFSLADVVVVPRIDGISSGIPGLAMTLGAFVICPNHGAFPEYIANTGNLTYCSGSSIDLSKTINESYFIDRVAVGLKSAEIAKEWKWSNVVSEILNNI